MTGVSLRIALLGAHEPLGEAVIAELGESCLDISELLPLACEDSDAMVSFAGEDLPVLKAEEGFNWADIDLLVVVDAHASAARHSAAARAAGRIVLHAGLSAWDLEDGSGRIPSGVALAVAKVLRPIKGAFGLESVDVFACVPVSMAGRAGVEELARQTSDVFAMREPDAEVFPVRMAFNLLPQVGAPVDSGATMFELRCAEDLRVALDTTELPVMVTAAWAPVFHGAALSLHGRAERALDLEALRACWRDDAAVTVMDESLPGGAPTPFTDAQESDGVFVGRLRVDSSDERRFAVWLVCDAARLEAARIVASIENKIEKSTS